MVTAKKIAQVEELREKLARCTIAIAANYQGLTVAEMGQLRRHLREAGVELRVVKNTLFRLAARQAGRPEAAALAEGPTAIAFGYGDEVAPAKALIEYLRTAPTPITLRRAYLGGQLLEPQEIKELAEIPPKGELLGRMVAAFQAPVAHLLGLLQSPLSALVGLLGGEPQTLLGLLEARARQLEGGSS